MNRPENLVLVPALCAARPGYALRAASLHLQAAGCQTARSAGTRKTSIQVTASMRDFSAAERIQRF
ncbi:MAG: hypothetical protein GY862_15785 [Gammaproteobacteria bacterium]|nr:hypothetical protein [Gammaproteobacteria bacterium]